MHFNTSHVVVYQASANAEYLWKADFNTSHVVVYHKKTGNVISITWFQYISCCSLSIVKQKRGKVNELFQYISCCSLSISLILWLLARLHFNTSHVVVYLHGSKEVIDCYTDFNTSHVVVYLSREEAIKRLEGGFQYISCCSLSYSEVICYAISFKFQYISCCSLSKILNTLERKYNWFQYISCCSLSPTFQSKLSVYRYFNTSHVVVYQSVYSLRHRDSFISIHLML